MPTARLFELIAAALVVAGTVFMAAAILAGRRFRGEVPPALARRWRWMTALMVFFLGGYLLFLVLLLASAPVPKELLSGAVFLGGAVFVYAMVDLSSRTIRRSREAEEDLRALVRGEPRRRRVSRQVLTSMSMSAYEHDYIRQAQSRPWYQSYDQRTLDELRPLGRRMLAAGARELLA